MGTWGVSLYANDTAADVRDWWLKKLKQGASGEEATAELLKEWGDADDPLFWTALADVQWTWGRLQEHVRERALREIAAGADLALWEGNKEREARARVFERLAARLATPPPPPKVVRVRADAVAWKRGQIWAYSTLDGRQAVLRVTAVDPNGGMVPAPVMELLDVTLDEGRPLEGLASVSVRSARPNYNFSAAYDFVPPEYRASPMFMPKVLERGGLPRHRLKKVRAQGAPRPMDIATMGYPGLPWWYLDHFLADKFDIGGPRCGAIHAWTIPDGTTAYTVIEFAHWPDTNPTAEWQLGILDCRDPGAPTRTLIESPVVASIVVFGFPPPGTFHEVACRQPDKDVAQVYGMIHSWADVPEAIERQRFYRTPAGRAALEAAVGRLSRK